MAPSTPGGEGPSRQQPAPSPGLAQAMTATGLRRPVMHNPVQPHGGGTARPAPHHHAPTAPSASTGVPTIARSLQVVGGLRAMEQDRNLASLDKMQRDDDDDEEDQKVFYINRGISECIHELCTENVGQRSVRDLKLLSASLRHWSKVVHRRQKTISQGKSVPDWGEVSQPVDPDYVPGSDEATDDSLDSSTESEASDNEATRPGSAEEGTEMANFIVDDGEGEEENEDQDEDEDEDENEGISMEDSNPEDMDERMLDDTDPEDGEAFV